MEDDFPHAHCHEDEIEKRVMEHEQKYCTPLNEDEMQELMMGVEADFEDCDCPCCEAV